MNEQDSFEQEIQKRMEDPDWSGRIGRSLYRRQKKENLKKLTIYSVLFTGFLTGLVPGTSWFTAYRDSILKREFVASQVNGIYSQVFPLEDESVHEEDLAYGKEEMRDDLDDLIITSLKKR